MDKNKITVESFYKLAWYNGFDKEIKRLYKYINKEYKKGSTEHRHVSMPEWLEEYDCNHFLRVFWSILVIEYGDYGTSPRYGWLECDRVKYFIKDLHDTIQEHNEAEKIRRLCQ